MELQSDNISFLIYLYRDPIGDKNQTAEIASTMLKATAAWLLVIIFDIIIMFKVLKLLLEVASVMSFWRCCPLQRRSPFPWAAAKARRKSSRAGAGCSAVCVC